MDKLRLILYAIIIFILVMISIHQQHNKHKDNSVIAKTPETIVQDETEIAIKPIMIETEETTVEIETAKGVEAFHLNDYERWVAECIVMGESGSESYEGQVLVAQCLLNACLKDSLQPSEVRIEYKYSGWNENPTDSVKAAVKAVFDDGYKITDEHILYFYAPKYAKGQWHETQRFIIELGGHRFFAEWNDSN